MTLLLTGVVVLESKTEDSLTEDSLEDSLQGLQTTAAS
jgi:hypothetical protein